MKYLVVFEPSENGWSAYAPDLPGLGVVGETIEEARQLISEGMPFHIEGLKSNGNAVPVPAAKAELIAVPE